MSEPGSSPSGRKAFPLRLSADVYDAVQRWAAEDLRSVNGQIEFLLREALKKAGRLLPGDGPSSNTNISSDP